MIENQSTHSVLMIRPAQFYSNPETAVTNEFQKSDSDVQLSSILAEFDATVARLRDAGVEVVVEQDTTLPETPDAAFPNNWLTTHANGQCVMYPMQPVSRRAERRADVVMRLATDHHFDVRHVLDWSDYEVHTQFLEGTGSMVLDRVNRIAYACRSARTHDEVLQQFCEQFNYTACLFDATGSSGKSIYHTNVMLCVGSGYAIACLEAIDDSAQRNSLRAQLGKHHHVVEISRGQMNQFAGNMLELRGTEGDLLLVMSSRALNALDQGQRQQISDFAQIVACPVDSIEDASGGSIRCMLAEIFLPSKARDRS